jgi:hypothetical protein
LFQRGADPVDAFAQSGIAGQPVPQPLQLAAGRAPRAHTQVSGGIALIHPGMPPQQQHRHGSRYAVVLTLAEQTRVNPERLPHGTQNRLGRNSA